MATRTSMTDLIPMSLRQGPGLANAAAKADKAKPKAKKPKRRGAANNLFKKRPTDVSGSLLEPKPTPAERPIVPAPMLMQEIGAEGRRSAKAIMARLLQDGISPLEVMVDNMRWAHNNAMGMLESIVGDIKEDKVKYEEGREDLFDRFVTMMRCREFAQTCARDAATYLHPKLQTIEVKQDERGRPKVIKRYIVDVENGTTVEGDIIEHARTGSDISGGEEDDPLAGTC